MIGQMHTCMFHPMKESFQRLLRFVVNGKVYQYRSLPFEWVNSTSSVHQEVPAISGNVSWERPSLPPLPGRLAVQGIRIPTMFIGYPAGTRANGEVGISGKLPEFGSDSVSGFRVCGDKIPTRHRLSSSSAGPHTEDGDTIDSIISAVSGTCVPVEISNRVIGITGEQDLVWQKASQTSSVSPEGVLSTAQGQLCNNGATSKGDFCASLMVDTTREPRTREALGILEECEHTGDGRIPRGIRRSLEGRDFSGNLEQGAEALVHNLLELTTIWLALKHWATKFREKGISQLMIL